MKNSVKKKLTIALAGNPNSGKSTIFNHLTGSRQHVGNYPGVTVEKKEGITNYKGYELIFVDLPGTYSLSAHSEDEIVARNFIINDKPDIIVHIIDASNLERNLYLFTQLSEIDIPLILVMNMSDMVDLKGIKIDYNELSDLLGKPVVTTVGNKNKGLDKLLEAIVDLHEGRIQTRKRPIDYGEEINQENHKIKGLLLENKHQLNGYPLEWLSLKLIEKDPLALSIIEKLPKKMEVLNQVEKSRNHLIFHYEDEPPVMIAERRYGFISWALAETVKTISKAKRHDISDKIDQIVLNRFLGIPVFALVMYGIFKFTFTLSEPIVGMFESIFESIKELAGSIIPQGMLQSFVVDGMIGGVGGVLGFFPLILFMFFAIAFFEDSGYMARAAFVMDRLMSKFGLHGKSFLPLMISTNGCAVPGIMASRTLENKRDRLITMMVTPFMICGAKLPIFALFTGAFFSKEQAPNIMLLMYALSLVIAFGSAFLLKKLVLKGEAAHFVMELPPYRMPVIKGLLLKMWERGWLYLKKAGSIILLLSIIVWGALSFPEYAPSNNESLNEEQIASIRINQSYAGRFGNLLEPIMKPIGLNGKSGIALITGLAAKEVVVSTLGTIYSLGNVDPEESESLKEALQNDPSWNPLKAMAFLIFCLIYLPCIVATSVFYRETGSSVKWLLFLIFWTTAMAWSASFLVYQGGLLLGWEG